MSKLKMHDILLAFGIVAFVILYVRKGYDWTLDYTLSVFVAITVFNWLSKRFFR